MHLLSPLQVFTFGNTLVATGLQLRHRNWQTNLRSLSHSSTSTWLARVNYPTIPDQQRHREKTLSYMEALNTPRDLHKDYQYDIHGMHRHLLHLEILVQTCHTGALALLLSLIMTCYCGWWCRGSTTLQRWRHGWKTHKMPWESWPVHGMRGYEARESFYITSFVKSSSFSQIIGC